MNKKVQNIKKVIASILIAGSLCVSAPFAVSAATTANSLSYEMNSAPLSETVEYLADGYSLTTSIYAETPVLTRASTYEQAGRKVISFKDSNGKLLWDYTISAVFTVNPGVSATCKTCAGTPKIYDNSWSIVSNKPSRSGNKATGTITMQKTVLGTVVQTITRTINLTCDANGNLS